MESASSSLSPSIGCYAGGINKDTTSGINTPGVRKGLSEHEQFMKPQEVRKKFQTKVEEKLRLEWTRRSPLRATMKEKDHTSPVGHSRLLGRCGSVRWQKIAYGDFGEHYRTARRSIPSVSIFLIYQQIFEASIRPNDNKFGRFLLHSPA